MLFSEFSTPVLPCSCLILFSCFSSAFLVLVMSADETIWKRKHTYTFIISVLMFDRFLFRLRSLSRFIWISWQGVGIPMVNMIKLLNSKPATCIFVTFDGSWLWWSKERLCLNHVCCLYWLLGLYHCHSCSLTLANTISCGMALLKSLALWGFVWLPMPLQC